MMLKSVLKRRKRISFIILLIICIIWMVPIIWGISTSLKTTLDIASNPISLIPEKISLKLCRDIHEN